MPLKIIFLAGYSAAGKSTLAKELEKKEFGFIEHQPLVHNLATSRGYPRARIWLKEEGLETFVRESTNEMIFQVKNLAKKNSRIVIDVTYGLEMLEKFTQRLPGSRLLVVGVISEEAVRSLRIKQRMGGVSDDEAKIERDFRDDFLRKTGVDEVLRNCDLRVENVGTPSEAVDQLLARISASE